MIKIQRRPVKKARIEIIPMIDVIFFLLVFFMISSLAHQKFNSLPVNLPKTSSSSNAVPQKITLTIAATGQIYLNKIPTSLSGLAEALAHEMREIPDETLVINADRGTSYGLVINAMDEAKKIGIRKFALLSQYEGIKK